MESFDVKIALKEYHRFKKAIEVTKSKIEVLDAKKYKAGGSIAKMPENPTDRQTIIINNMGKSECLEVELSHYRYWVNIAEAFIKWLPEQDSKMVNDRFVRNKTWAWIELNHYITPQGARKRILSLIEDFIGEGVW